VVEEGEEVEADAHADLDLLEPAEVGDGGLVDDVAAAGAEFELLRVLPRRGSTLEFSSSISRFCSLSRSKLPSRFARWCSSASSTVGYPRMSTRISPSSYLSPYYGPKRSPSSAIARFVFRSRSIIS
jgi:hypothetical protein